MQSRRKQAEQRVIDAARGLERLYRSVQSHFLSGEGRELMDSVAALKALDLTPIDNGSDGAVGVNSPDTSRSAAASVRATSSEVRRLILDELTAVHHTAAQGLICAELEKRIQRQHTTTSSQVNFLMNHGWIKDSGYRRMTPSGRAAIVWRLTDQALDKIMNQGAP